MSRIAAYILPVVNLIAWGFCEFGFYDGLVARQGRVGSSDLGQVTWYAIMPLAALLVVFVPPAFVPKDYRNVVLNVLSAVMLILLLPFLTFSGGGM